MSRAKADEIASLELLADLEEDLDNAPKAKRLRSRAKKMAAVMRAAVEPTYPVIRGVVVDSTVISATKEIRSHDQGTATDATGSDGVNRKDGGSRTA